MRKRDKLYRRWSRSGRPDDQKKFLDQKHLVRRITERAYEKYLSDILGINRDDDDLDAPPKVKTKKLYSLLKHSKQDSSGISSLKADGKTYSEDIDKANTLNRQFHSVFSPKSPISLEQLAKRTLQDLHDSDMNHPIESFPGSSPPFNPSPHRSMPTITISTQGIEKLLKGLNPHKAAGPDKLKPIVLQTLHKELAPLLKIIFQRSLDSGKLPSIWKEAHVSPIFKKGDKTDPANYRPISLTCVLCKVLEHVVASGISKHFTDQNILFELQHGFREKRSCETQLIMLVDELARNMQSSKQTDLILLDFSKAFDKVAHEKLLSKLHYYGIRGNTLRWIKDFLDNRSQAVILNGSNSDSIPVSSGVPQGSVLGPILFLAYINDLPDQVRSRVRLFADDTAMYLALDIQGDSEILQKDLESLEKWEKLWDMSFNPAKCQVIHVTRRKIPFQTKYILHGCVLESVSSAKYLGVTISDDLRWTNHINDISKKANQTLGFLKRNIRVHNRDLKATAYKTLVRPQLEYASTVWSPHTATDIYKLESVQRRAARWVTHDYQYTSSVSAMLQDLNWRTLDQRRIDSRLVLLYKVTYDLVAIPASDYLIRNTRPSSRSHPLAYRQITTLKDYYRFTFFPRTIIHWNSLPPHIPVLPTLAQFSIAVCQVV
ncbi:MAG: reverse transcriptase family protein, partial [Candidatus Thiodiazotropha sp.]